MLYFLKMKASTGRSFNMHIIQKVFLVFISTALLFAAGCKSDTRNKEGASSGPIKTGAVDFPGMQLRPGNTNGSFTLVGRIRNRSAQQTITEVTLRITMEDVLATGPTTTVGNTILVLKQEVPPGDSKNFSEKVTFGKLPSPKGRLEWNYSVAGVNVKE
jgi:hypothetical protein